MYNLKASCNSIFSLFSVPNNAFPPPWCDLSVYATGSVLDAKGFPDVYIDFSKWIPFQMKVLVLHWQVPQKTALNKIDFVHKHNKGINFKQFT